MIPLGMRTYRKKARRIDTWMTGNDTGRDESVQIEDKMNHGIQKRSTRTWRMIS